MKLTGSRFGRLGYLVKFLFISTLTFLLISISITKALGEDTQLPIPKGLLKVSELTELEAQISSRRVGNLIFAPVNIDGREVFRVAAEVSEESKDQQVESLLKRRVNLIESKIHEIINRGFDPETLKVTVNSLNGQTTIFVADGKHQDLTKKIFINLTDLDAQLYGLPLPEWAQQLSQIIRTNLIKAQRERQPEYLWHQTLSSGKIILGTILISILLRLLQKYFKAQIIALYKKQPHSRADEQANNDENILTIERKNLFSIKQQKLIWQFQVNLNNLLRFLLQIGMIVIWVVGLAWIAGLFPWSRWLYVWLIGNTILFVGIGLGANIALKLSNFLIDWFLAMLAEEASLSSVSSQRQTLRVATFSGVLKGITSFAVIAISIFLLLNGLGIPFAPVLAGVGLLGLGISFSAQSLVKDLINGVLILIEDQYATGDYITVGTVTGLVENMNLRFTQIRDIRGILTTIPHGSIEMVQNLTKDWSRINFTVEVSYDTDMVEAMEVIKQAAEEMSADPLWEKDILDPVDALGISQLAHTGIQVLIRIKTRPGQQWDVEREFCRRLKIAFDQHGISIGVPQQKVISKTDIATKIKHLPTLNRQAR